MSKINSKQNKSAAETKKAGHYYLSECPTLTETQKYALLKRFNERKSDSDHIILNDIGFANAEVMLEIVKYSYLIYGNLCEAYGARLDHMDEHIFIAIAMNYILIPHICFFDTKKLAHYIANYFDDNQKEVKRAQDVYFWAADKETCHTPLKYLLCLQYESCLS